MEAGTAAAPTAARTREGRRPGGRRRGGKLLDWGLNLYALLALLYLLVPILVILVFSFNNPVGRFNFIWQEFSFEAWTDPFGVPGIGDALLTSVEIAALSTLAATALGTITALALVRYEFKGRAPINFFIFIPLATPEVVLGAALLSMFLNFLVATGFGTILIAHIMFNLSFVIITVRSRLIGFDRSLEEAAQDLGATAWQTFRLITLPLIMPGVVAAALLAFALSIDDFVITNFNAGSTITFPLFIWGAARVAVPPQIYVIASMIFLVTLALMLLTVWQQRRAEKMAAVRTEPEEDIVEAQAPAAERSEHGLKKDAIGFVDGLIIGIASTAPAYSLAAVLAIVVVLVGVQAPAVLLASFVPMFLIASAFYYMNRADPDCGTTFSWVTRAMGPALGWVGGWAITTTGSS